MPFRNDDNIYMKKNKKELDSLLEKDQSMVGLGAQFIFTSCVGLVTLLANRLSRFTRE